MLGSEITFTFWVVFFGNRNHFHFLGGVLERRITFFFWMVYFGTTNHFHFLGVFLDKRNHFHFLCGVFFEEKSLSISVWCLGQEDSFSLCRWRLQLMLWRISLGSFINLKLELWRSVRYHFLPDYEKYSLVKSTSQFQTGHLTSSVGSGVLGSTLVAGLVTAGPALTVGLFAGTVLTSVGGSCLGQTGW